MTEPNFWWQVGGFNLSKIASQPLAWLYRSATLIRRLATRPQRAPIPIVCIGNLTLGGAGKTPCADYLASALASAGMKPAILSRGYGGSVTATQKVDPAQHSAHMVGDEPAMLAQRHAVFVGADRMASARLAAAQGYQIGIKDDGLQNPNLHHDINILVLDGPRGLGNGGVFPAGPLREPWTKALPRIDLVILIGAAAANLAPFLSACRAAQIPIVSAQLRPVATSPKAVHAFCGIANPEKFYATLRGAGYSLLSQTSFPDHHFLTESEAATLLLKARGAPLMTTEKDAVRLVGESGARAKLGELAEVLPVKLAPESDLAALTLARLKHPTLTAPPAQD